MRINAANIRKNNKLDKVEFSKMKASAKLIASLSKGDIVKGTVVDILRSNISIKLNNGEVLDAKLLKEMSMAIGDNLAFEVTEKNENMLLLKPMLEDTKDAKIIDVLKMANMTINEKNIDLVKKLIQNNMPINKESLKDFLVLSNRFEDSSIDELIMLKKNNMLVSKESIEYIKEFLNNDLELSNKITNVSKEISKLDNNELLKVTKNILGETNVANKILESIVSGQKTNNLELKEVMSSTNLAELSKILDSNITTNEELYDKVNEKNSHEVLKLLTESIINKELFADTKEIFDMDKLTDKSKKLYEKLTDLLKDSSFENNPKMQELNKSVNEAKTTIDLTSQLQNQYQFIHIPINLNGNNADTKLYIMHNKKKKSKESGITALIRLDLRNLKHLDIYVAKKEKEVEITFYSDNDLARKDLINQKNDLAKEIIKEGLKIVGININELKKEFNIVDDFLETNKKSVKYTFDVRA